MAATGEPRDPLVVHRPRLVLGVLTGLVASAQLAGAEPHRIHVETDPLPPAQGGYGLQAGVRPAGSHWRVAVASFSLDVPDFAVQGGGNDGFHLRVRPSAAVYVLRYHRPGRDGWLYGASLRYLRLRYTHDDVAGERADLAAVSPELIGGYKWHPGGAGFYVQPWAGVGVLAWTSDDATVGTRAYDGFPLQPFLTVNLGWEFELR
jgi:hypothetical protein